jgi:hypothetical protein
MRMTGQQQPPIGRACAAGNATHIQKSRRRLIESRRRTGLEIQTLNRTSGA